MTRHYWRVGNRTYEQDRWQKGDSPDDWDACWYTGMPDLGTSAFTSLLEGFHHKK